MTVIYILKSTPCGYLIFRFNSFEVTYRIRKVTEMVEPHFLMTPGLNQTIGLWHGILLLEKTSMGYKRHVSTVGWTCLCCMMEL